MQTTLQKSKNSYFKRNKSDRKGGNSLCFATQNMAGLLWELEKHQEKTFWVAKHPNKTNLQKSPPEIKNILNPFSDTDDEASEVKTEYMFPVTATWYPKVLAETPDAHSFVWIFVPLVDVP